MAPRNTKMQTWINHRVRVTIQDGRALVGTFMAFDPHMNIVLADCEEYRITRQAGSGKKQEIKRGLGLVMLRGTEITTMVIEAPPMTTGAMTSATPGAHVPGISPAGISAGRGRGIPTGLM
eukprot:GHVH01000038.1.p1 GENE.GHVH01000038.1~~GHVH01000038.1.p1  ORF type:complete len:121 (-),score=9.74 GHVH01000038.1:64-426(-)